MTERDIGRTLGYPSRMCIELDELLDKRQIDIFGKLAGKRKLATLYYLVSPSEDADLDLTTNVFLRPSAVDFDAESGSGPRHIRLPPWFRVDRSNVQSLEDLIEWPKGETVRVRQPISKEKKEWNNHALCSGIGESTRLDSLCKRASNMSLWDHVSQKELNFQGDEAAVVLFLLYDLRAEIFI